MNEEEPAGIVMPRGWWAIPLQPAVERERQVRELVERQFVGAASQPALKQSVRAALSGVAADAARVGGKVLAMDLTRVREVALATTLVVFRPASPQTMDQVAATLRGRDGVVSAPGEHGVIVREVKVGTAPDVEGSAPFPQLRAEYWLDPQDGLGLYHAVFTSPHVQMQEALLEMFDTMVSTVSAPT